MRTTITLNPDVYIQLEEYARERQTSFKQAVNELLQRGLATPEPAAPERFSVRPHRAAFLPGVDPARLNQLLDELEIEDFVSEATRA